jgi:hypothetical protein
MYNVGDVVKLSEYGMRRLYWWDYRMESFEIVECDPERPEQYTAMGVTSRFLCILHVDYIEMVKPAGPVNIEEFL